MNRIMGFVIGLAFVCIGIAIMVTGKFCKQGYCVDFSGSEFIVGGAVILIGCLVLYLASKVKQIDNDAG